MEMKIEITKRSLAKTVVVIVMMFVVGFASFMAAVNMTYPHAHKKGYEKGYLAALSDVSEKTGITFEWKDRGDGKYEITAYQEGTLYAMGVAEVHIWIEHWRNGILLSKEFGAGTLTTYGKNHIEQQLSGTLNATQRALYCSDSNDASAPSAAWTILPSEITSNGLDRQTGTYASTGDGTWNVTVTKSVTGTQSTQLWGLNVDPGDNVDGYLLAADSTPAQKNCISGDTMKETWQITVS